MATKLYFPSTGSPPVLPSYSSGWTDTSLAARLPCFITKEGTSNVNVSVADSDDTDKTFLLRQYITPPLEAGQTIGAQTLNMVIKASETDAGNNLFTAVAARLVKEDGTDYGSPLTICSLTLDNTELATSATSRNLQLTTTSQTTSAGDRLVIEIGVSGNPDAGKTHSSTIIIGDNNANDLTAGDADTDVDNPYIQLATSTLNWYGHTWYFPSTTTTPSVSPAYDAAWNATGQAARRIASTHRTSSAMTTVTLSDADETNQDVLRLQYVSPALRAQTLAASQTARITIRALETDLGNNIRLSTLIRVVDSTGTDYSPVRYIWPTGGAIQRDGTEASATTLTNQNTSNSTTASTVTINDGDRLVFEFGMGGDPATGKSHSGSLSFGDDSATDLAANDTGTAADNPLFLFATSGVGIWIKDTVANIQYDQAVSATETPTASVSRQLSLHLSPAATCTGTATVSRQLTLFRNASATCTGTVTHTYAHLYYQNSGATCTGTVTSDQVFHRGLSILGEAYGFPTMTLVTTRVKSVSATCTGTAVNDPDRHRHVPVVEGTLTCTGTANCTRIAKLQGHVSHTPGRILVTFDL